MGASTAMRIRLSAPQPQTLISLPVPLDSLLLLRFSLLLYGLTRLLSGGLLR